MILLEDHRAQRRALVAACLPTASLELPPLAELDLSAFWARLDSTAPVHLRAGVAAATLAFAALAPLVLRRRARLSSLTPEDWERLFAFASGRAPFDDLIMVVKVVACLAYFDDDGVQDTVRAEARP